MRTAVLCCTVFLVPGVWAGGAFAEARFQYAGVDLETADFSKVFPTSLIRDEEVWVSREDSQAHAYYVRRIHFKDHTQIRIVLETPERFLEDKPRSWKEGHYTRFPSCPEVLTMIQGKYGHPVAENRYSEERLVHHVRTWLAESERLDLDCYRIDGKGKELAAEVTLSRRENR